MKGIEVITALKQCTLEDKTKCQNENCPAFIKGFMAGHDRAECVRVTIKKWQAWSDNGRLKRINERKC